MHGQQNIKKKKMYRIVQLEKINEKNCASCWCFSCKCITTRSSEHIKYALQICWDLCLTYSGKKRYKDIRQYEILIVHL